MVKEVVFEKLTFPKNDPTISGIRVYNTREIKMFCGAVDQIENENKWRGFKKIKENSFEFLLLFLKNNFSKVRSVPDQQRGQTKYRVFLKDLSYHICVNNMPYNTLPRELLEVEKIIISNAEY